MAECSKCGKNISMPFTCKFCGDSFCSTHRLPENHDCDGLDDYKRREKEESSEVTYDIQRKEEEHREQEERQRNVFDRGKAKLRSWKRKAKRWLNGGRSQRSFMPGQQVRRSPMAGAMRQAFPEVATFTLLGMIFVTFLAQQMIGVRTSIVQYGLVPSMLAAEPWRIVTSMFMHANSLHLLVNAMVLFFFGAELEKRVGTKRFLKIYFAAGLVAALGFAGFMQLFGNTAIPAVGASGALYGVFAALAILAPEIRVLAFFIFPMGIRTALIVFALLDVFLLSTSVPIASAAHLSGLVVGLYYGHKLKGRIKKQFNFMGL
ncbi:MAG: rhomboid family intramembrane serine protease [Candidatus Nanohaloarchaea archaeon]|nr:rhomboid family intramembrane serine protease [Candidatus Nanohaloarchaea archaeon]